MYFSNVLFIFSFSNENSGFEFCRWPFVILYQLMMNIGVVCLLLLWDICNMSLAFKITEEDAGHLLWLVEAFLELFSTLYYGKSNGNFCLYLLLSYIGDANVRYS